MTCREFGDIAVDLGRGELDTATEHAALEHTRVCPSCAAIRARELRLREALCGSASSCDADARIESVLLAAFDATRHRHRGRRSRLQLAAAMVVAAAAIVVAAVLLSRPSRVPQPHPMVPVAPAPVVASTGAPSAPSRDAATPAPARTPKRRLRRTVPAPPVQPQPPAVVAGAATAAAAADEAPFVALPFAAGYAPATNAQVIRVRMPRSALRGFGFFVTPDSGSAPDTETYQADVIVGEDTIPRAIRFATPYQYPSPSASRRISYEPNR